MRPDTGRNDPAFEFRGSAAWICAGESATAVPRGTSATLGARLARAFDGAPESTIVAGALPFDLTEEDSFWVSTSPRIGGLAGAAPSMAGWTIREMTPAAVYEAGVARALEIIAAGAGQPDGLQKLVLARRLEAMSDREIDRAALMDRLTADPAATAFMLRLPERGQGPRYLAGASPELLMEKRGDRIISHPLAGSSARSADPHADAAARASLAASSKDRHEHRHVVEFLLDTLAPLCHELRCPDGPEITSTRALWHLGTRIEGRLRDPEEPSALLATRVHPTPAVCGVPQARAAALIPELEDGPRGFYAGTVGWNDRRGDGSWYVTIRSAEIEGRVARLHAGAGLVLGSDPETERRETATKFRTFLSALGLEGAELDTLVETMEASR
ncbi:isochorismate synthase [Poseidonocella pacifica]|uniref:isochorismate synthase n=1 Tax=Poseidonocella pacifica TaxID=871651 RepID=A0A1I0V4F8_9RHOB|nr:isochorismate synthase [Poseidonocella pacifica]